MSLLLIFLHLYCLFLPICTSLSFLKGVVILLLTMQDLPTCLSVVCLSMRDLFCPIILNLIIGCVSPQYHCCFDNFFKTTRHGALDVSGTICWQELANLDRAPRFFRRCQHQNSIALYLWRHHLKKKLILPANQFLCPLCMTSHQMITMSQTENHMWQRTFIHLDGIRLLTQMRESHQLSLLSWLVQANAEELAPFYKEWLNPCPNKISLETKVCTTWLQKLIWAKVVKTSSMTPTFNYKSGWGTLLPSMQKWWVTSCIFKKRSDSQMQRNLYKPSSRKLTDMWIATTGHCKKDVKSLRMFKLYLLYGHYDASMISQQTKSIHTRPGWTQPVESKSMEWVILRHMHLMWHGLPSD